MYEEGCLERGVGAVAENGTGAVIASAKVYGLCLGCVQFHWRSVGGFVVAIAERLVGAQSAGAPEMAFSGFNLNGIRTFLGNLRFRRRWFCLQDCWEWSMDGLSLMKSGANRHGDIGRYAGQTTAEAVLMEFRHELPIVPKWDERRGAGCEGREVSRLSTTITGAIGLTSARICEEH